MNINLCISYFAEDARAQELHPVGISTQYAMLPSGTVHFICSGPALICCNDRGGFPLVGILWRLKATDVGEASSRECGWKLIKVLGVATNWFIYIYIYSVQNQTQSPNFQNYSNFIAVEFLKCQNWPNANTAGK